MCGGIRLEGCYTEFGAADERSEKVWYTGWITIQILTAVRFPKVVYDTFAYRHPFGTSVSHTVQVYTSPDYFSPKINQMQQKILLLSFAILLFIQIGCDQEITETREQLPDMTETYKNEKAAILRVLNEETAAAFNRRYEDWRNKWVHEAYVTKTYMNLAEGTNSETLGWQEVDEFVRTYIEEHPEPAPLPAPVEEIEVRLYGIGAWVSFEQLDPERGHKRETRLMEKVEGQWKIAGMQTVIYGFDKE